MNFICNVNDYHIFSRVPNKMDYNTLCMPCNSWKFTLVYVLKNASKFGVVRGEEIQHQRIFVCIVLGSLLD